MTPRLPYPVVGGDRLRIYRICASLAEDFDITLVSLCESPQLTTLPPPADGVFKRVRLVHLPRWRSYLNAALAILSGAPLQVAYYRSSRLRAVVDEELPKHDLALAHLVRTEGYLADSCVPTIVELTDAISLNYSRSAKILGWTGLRPVIYAFERRRLLKWERAVQKRHTLVGMISAVDARYLFGDPLPANVLVYGNGVDPGALRLDYRPGMSRDIAFIGNMTTLQNMDAAHWFASEVLPLLRRHAEFRLRLIGRIALRERERLERRPGVVVTGEVPSIPAAAQGCFAAVCSVRVGAGVQNKVLEYLALGLPTVTSSVGAEGLAGSDGTHFLVADDPGRMAEQLLRIHAEPRTAEALSRRGRSLVEREYEWGRMLAPLRAAATAMVASRTGLDAAGARAAAAATCGTE